MGRPEQDEARQALVDDILAMMARMRTMLVDLIDPISLPTDLTMQQLRVLVMVARAPSLTAHELAEKLAVSAPTVTGLIDRLAEKGLLGRVPDAADRRVRRLSPSASGRELVQSLDTALDQVVGLLRPQMSAVDLEVIRDAARVLLTAVERAKSGADDRVTPGE